MSGHTFVISDKTPDRLRDNHQNAFSLPIPRENLKGGRSMKTRLTVTLIVFIVAVALSAMCVEKSRAEALGISNIVFCSSNPKGYMDYEEQSDATFKPGETVWIYMNLDHVKTNTNSDGSKEIWIKLHLKVKAPNGDVLLDQDLYNEHKNFP
jgi:hypothetical protein